MQEGIPDQYLKKQNSDNFDFKKRKKNCKIKIVFTNTKNSAAAFSNASLAPVNKISALIIDKSASHLYALLAAPQPYV